MQGNSKEVLPGFISIDDAIALIEKHTATKPTVDLPRMMRGYHYIIKGNNFSIFQKEVVNGVSVPRGYRPVTIYTDYDKERLKNALRTKYAEIAGREFDEAKARAVARTSAISDNDMSGKPRKSKKSIAKVGEDVTTSKTMSSNDYKGSADGASTLNTALEA